MERPLLSVTVAAGEKPDLPSDMQKRWLDLDTVLQRERQRRSATAYYGEAYPDYWPNLGPGSFGTFLGAQPHFLPDTVWYDPCCQKLQELQPHLDPDNPWWQWSLAATERAVAECDGSYLISTPDLVENLDTVAALAGTETVLFGLMEAGDELQRIQEQLLPLWEQAFQAHYDRNKDAAGWSSFAAFGIWGPGKTAKLQCDLSAMISKPMFDTFVLPYLQRQCHWLDHSIYHLDGPQAVHHLPSLLTLDKLHCIQWTPGAGNPDGGDPQWDHIYRTTLDAGKNIHAHMELEAVRPFIKRFGTTGVFVQTTAATTEEAEQLIKDLENAG